MIVNKILVTFYGIFTVMRISFALSAIILNQKSEVKESKFSLTLLPIYITSIIIILTTYIIKSDWFAWGNIPNYPYALIWFGMIMGVFSLVLFIIAHIHLGKYYSFILKIHQDHKFVSSGLYRFIRHPMYTAYILFHTAIFLITGNWFIGIIWIGGICFILFLRIRKEEESLIETFGDEYREYKKRTGILFPPIFKLFKGKTKESNRNSRNKSEINGEI